MRIWSRWVGWWLVSESEKNAADVFYKLDEKQNGSWKRESHIKTMTWSMLFTRRYRSADGPADGTGETFTQRYYSADSPADNALECPAESTIL